jgi:hypothetical protein
MTEKYFAATPYLSHGVIIDLHEIMQTSIKNYISMASDKILSKLKDFEGFYAHASKSGRGQITLSHVCSLLLSATSVFLSTALRGGPIRSGGIFRQGHHTPDEGRQPHVSSCILRPP